MRIPSTLRGALFGAGVAAVLGLGVTAAYAPPAAASEALACPAYTATERQCDDCCWQQYGGFGAWSPSTHRCICGF